MPRTEVSDTTKKKAPVATKPDSTLGQRLLGAAIKGVKQGAKIGFIEGTINNLKHFE